LYTQILGASGVTRVTANGLARHDAPLQKSSRDYLVGGRERFIDVLAI
jgi:hypothetical protein